MPLSDFEIITRTLRFRRKSLRITQKQLGQMIGVSPRTIYALESADTSISVKTLLDAVATIGFGIEVSRKPNRFDAAAQFLGQPLDANRKDVWRYR